MHSGAKLIIGIIIFLAGIYWYAAPLFGDYGLQNFFRPYFTAPSTFGAFVAVFAGLFGLALIFLGLIISWIEYEDLKWESREKRETRRKEQEEMTQPKKRGRK